MPHTEDCPVGQSQFLTSDGNTVRRYNSHYGILEAYDTLTVTRCSETYLEALEHYLYASGIPYNNREQIMLLLRLYRDETAAGLDRTASILKEALDSCWNEPKSDDLE